jgi:hypothetical protein
VSSLLFNALVWPLLVFGGMTLSLSWPAVLPISAVFAFFGGLIARLNEGYRTLWWVIPPVLLAHLQIVVWTWLGVPGWWVALIVQLAAIGWLVWAYRETLLAALLLAWFCLVYCGISASLLFSPL